MFLICPVRNASGEEIERLNSIIKKHENEGYHVHYPARDTNQNPIVNGLNTGGYNICLENARALASSNVVAMFYNKESTGSMFDLGVTYELAIKNANRQFILENDVAFDKNNFIDLKVEVLKSGLNEKDSHNKEM